MLILKDVLAKAKDTLTDEEKAFLKEHASELTDEQKTQYADVLGAADGDGMDEAALKALIQKSASDIMAKKVDEISDAIVEKFTAGVAAQRKLAIDTGKPAHDTNREVTANFLKALFQGDTARLKADGYLDTGTSASAGLLVPVPLQAEVLRIANTQYGLARRDFRYLPFSGPGNSRTIPVLGSSVAVTWTDEAGVKGRTKFTVGPVTQTLKKLAAIVPFTDELLEDSAINLTELVAQLIAEAISKEEDIQFFAGVGVPWTGILNNGSVNAVDTVAGTIAGLTADDLLALIDATPSGALQGAKFYFHRSVLSVIRKLKASTSGQYVFQSPGGAVPGSIWDYPYETSDAFPAVGDINVGDPFIVFGNLKVAAIFGDKQQLRVKVLTEATLSSGDESGEDELNLAEQDMTALRFVERVGYVLALPKAVSVLSVGSGS